MRTIAKDKTSSAVSESGASTPKDGAQENWFRTHWCMVALCVVALLAFLLRFVFAYGPSVSDDFALSGGSNASSHHRIIVDILWGTFNPANQGSLNYPYGAESIVGPLFDYCCAAWAKLFTVFGASYDEAASMALAINPPIFGALTCIPVFLIADRFFKDKVIAILAAVFYAAFPILIMTTPFSYGSEFPCVCFLMSGLIYFTLSAFDNIDKYAVTGIKGVFTTKPVLLWIGLDAVFMVMMVLVWTGFWAIVMASSVMLFFALLFDRIGGRDIGATVGVFAAVITVPVLLGSIYYFIIGAWASILSGGFTLAVLTTVYAAIFLAVQKKPWVFTVPAMVVLIAVVAAVLYFVAPELSAAVYSGNSVYSGTLMEGLISESTRTSISAMAAYYGWVTVWCPLLFGVWMAYKYRDNAKSKAYTFVMLWLFAGFFACWFNTEYAVVAGCVFSVASAATIVGIFRYVDVKAYLRSLKGNGIKAGAKKALNFFPLVTVLVAVFLVAAPTAVYAIDAATPTNNENIDYFGGLGYTITTSDSSLVNSAWSGYHPTQEATLLTWYGYSDSASSVGGYKTVTSSSGAGTSAMSSAYLSDGSAGTIATMIIRLIETDAAAYSTQIVAAHADDLVNIVDDSNVAKKYIRDHSADFVGYNADLACESLPYIAGVHYLTNNLSEKQIVGLYDAIRAASGHTINYIELDGSMIPLYYGDGSYANYLGYFGDYTMGGTYSTPAKFYTVTSTTSYYYQWGYYDQLYYTYNDAMYATFLWNALIGATPAQYGLDGNLALLSALAKSDGTVKATPLSGIDNFDIAYWHVNYQPKDSDEWKNMDIKEALAAQNETGGYINYLSSVIILEYKPTASYQEVTVSGAADYSGVRVAVYEKLSEGDFGYDPSGKVSNYVQRSSAFVDKTTGKADVNVPSGDYVVKYYVGATTLYNGTLINTQDSIAAYALPVIATQHGTLVDGDGNAVLNSGAYLEFVGSDKVSKTVTVGADGTFSLDNVKPDTYTVNVYSASDSLVNTVKATLSDPNGDEITGFTVSAGACTLNITVNDMYGAALSGTVHATVVDAAGVSSSVAVVDGTASVSVLAGTYTVYINADNYVSVESKTVKATAKDPAKATLVAYAATEITGVSAGTIVSVPGYSTVATGSSVFVPAPIAGLVTAYQLNTEMTKVTYSINGTTHSDVDVVKLNGTLKDGSKGVSGTITFTGSDKATFTFAAGSDGKFTAYLPAAEYTVYATNGKDLSYIGTQTVAAGDSEYSLETAYAVTTTLKYDTLMSPSTAAVGYADLKITVGTMDFYAAINGSGEYKFYLPSGKDATVKALDGVTSVYGFDTTAGFSKDVTGISSATSVDFKIKAKEDTANPVAFTKPVDVVFHTGISAAVQFFFDAYAGSTYDIKDAEALIADGDHKTVVPGRYTVTVADTDAGHYINTTVYIYPSITEVDLTSCIECTKVTVTKVDSDDVVTLVTIEDKVVGDEVIKPVTDGDKYYLPNGGEYYFTITNAAGDKTARFAPAAEIKEYTLAEAVTLSGYVGSKIEGDITAASGADKYKVTVKAGEYTLKVATGTVIDSMELTGTNSPEKDTYTYSVTAASLITSAVTVDADKTMNFAVEIERAVAENDTFDSVEITGTMGAGKGNLTLTAKRKDTVAAETYVVAAGTGFELSKSYVLRFAAGDDTASVNVEGRYNDAAIGAGSASASLIIQTLDGTAVQTATIPGDLYGGTSLSIFVDNHAVSAMDGYAYKYALVFRNDGQTQTTVKIVGVGSSTPFDGYDVAVVDASGNCVTKVNTAAPEGTYELNGLESTTLYIMFIKKTADETESLPATLEVYYEFDGAISDNTTIDLASAEISVDAGSVTGGNADNSEKEVPTGFWILVVFAVLLILLIIWGGMKRGVFSRRN